MTSNLRLLGFLPIVAAVPAAGALSPEEVFERVAPSVWNVQTFDGENKSVGYGSAVVIDKGMLITNCHVLLRAKSFKVAHDKQTYSGKLDSPDVERDLCRISVPEISVPPVPLVRMANLKVGQKVYAIGNPRKLELTMSDGIISGFRDMDGLRVIQTTAAISPGSSGGGLFDAEGRLVGITTFQYQNSFGQNLNFAHPAEWILEVPERAKTALAKRAEKVAAETKAKGAEASRYPRRIVGEEFAAHFQGLFQVEAVTGTGSRVLLTLRPDGDAEMRNLKSGRWSPGTSEMKLTENRICMRFVNSYFRIANDCYQLLETGPSAYSLKSLSDNYFISYKIATQ